MSLSNWTSWANTRSTICRGFPHKLLAKYPGIL